MPRYLDHKPESVVICGMGPSLMTYMMEAMSQDLKLSYADEVWVINAVGNVLHHDVLFWMDDMVEENKVRPDLFKLMNRRGKPVITSTAYPDLVPTSYDYPFPEVCQTSMNLFGKFYLNNGLAMMLAYAIAKGVKHVRMFGCDFTYPNKPHAENGKGCVESWICASRAAGMKITLPGNTSLFDLVEGNRLYGFTKQPTVVLPDGTEIQCQDQPELAYYEAPESTIRPEATA